MNLNVTLSAVEMQAAIKSYLEKQYPGNTVTITTHINPQVIAFTMEKYRPSTAPANYDISITEQR